MKVADAVVEPLLQRYVYEPVPQPPTGVTVTTAVLSAQTGSCVNAIEQERAGVAFTVKVDIFTTSASQLLVAVQVTVTDPPQALGAPAELLVTCRLHPPLALPEANHVAYAASIAACPRHASAVCAAGGVSETLVAAVTVKVDDFTTSASHELLAVQVTVTDPPQALGAPAELVVT